MILRMMTGEHQRKGIVVAGDGWRDGSKTRPDNLGLPPRPVLVLWVVSQVLGSDTLRLVDKWTFFWFS